MDRHKLFGANLSNIINVSNWIKYPKTFYLEHLNYLFNYKNLAHLFEICEDQFPIIPVPEFVLSKNNIESVHDSFLFPIKYRNKLAIFWESVVDYKATYIFDVADTYIYDA